MATMSALQKILEDILHTEEEPWKYRKEEILLDE
jgi:hypothetical protein